MSDSIAYDMEGERGPPSGRAASEIVFSGMWSAWKERRVFCQPPAAFGQRRFGRRALPMRGLTGARRSVIGAYRVQMHGRLPAEARQAPRTRPSSRLRRQFPQSGSRRPHREHSGTLQLWSAPLCRQCRQLGIRLNVKADKVRQFEAAEDRESAPHPPPIGSGCDAG